MVSKFEEELFTKCFDKWGVESQLIMLIEECAELIQSISKDMYRNKPKRNMVERFDRFSEEIADVQIMIDEFIFKFNLEPNIKYYRTVKCERLQKLLDDK